MQTFLRIWLGQIISVVGTYITDFALGVWAYQTTGSLTLFALILVLTYLPNLLISPFAGVLVDRWNRRSVMLVADSVTGVTAIAMMLLVSTGNLEIWHIYLGVSISSISNAFHIPAYISAIAQVVPKQHLGRANGMVQISRAMARILGPTIAGFLIEAVQLQGVLLFDFATYLLATIALLSVRIPDPKPAEKSDRKTVNLDRIWDEISSGWDYVAARPGLLGLMIFFGVTYLTEGMIQVLFWPIILNFASSSELGIVLSISGCGMLFGSLFVSAWGGLKRQIHGILFFVSLQGLCLCLGGFQPTLFLAAIGGFGYLFSQPIVVSSNQTIWQCKIPTYLQGRVFALQGLLEKSLLVITQLSVGPLVDRFFEPMMMPGGFLAETIGQVIGSGPGRGSALLLCGVGILNLTAAFIAYRTPRLRRVETEIPDAIAPTANAVSS